MSEGGFSRSKCNSNVTLEEGISSKSIKINPPTRTNSNSIGYSRIQKGFGCSCCFEGLYKCLKKNVNHVPNTLDIQEQ